LAARHAQFKWNAIPDRSHLGLHPLVCGLTAELTVFGRNDVKARYIDRPFIDQSMGDLFPTAHIKHTRNHKLQARRSRRMDETYIKVNGVWTYLYRAVDKLGKTVDFLLTTKRDLAAAKRFLTKDLGANDYPEKVAID
jgi:hypothetical protein